MEKSSVAGRGMSVGQDGVLRRTSSYIKNYDQGVMDTTRTVVRSAAGYCPNQKDRDILVSFVTQLVKSRKLSKKHRKYALAGLVDMKFDTTMNEMMAAGVPLAGDKRGHPWHSFVVLAQNPAPDLSSLWEFAKERKWDFDKTALAAFHMKELPISFDDYQKVVEENRMSEMPEPKVEKAAKGKGRLAVAAAMIALETSTPPTSPTKAKASLVNTDVNQNNTLLEKSPAAPSITATSEIAADLNTARLPVHEIAAPSPAPKTAVPPSPMIGQGPSAVLSITASTPPAAVVSPITVTPEQHQKEEKPLSVRASVHTTVPFTPTMVAPTTGSKAPADPEKPFSIDEASPKGAAGAKSTESGCTKNSASVSNKDTKPTEPPAAPVDALDASIAAATIATETSTTSSTPTKAKASLINTDVTQNHTLLEKSSAVPSITATPEKDADLNTARLLVQELAASPATKTAVPPSPMIGQGPSAVPSITASTSPLGMVSHIAVTPEQQQQKEEKPPSVRASVHTTVPSTSTMVTPTTGSKAPADPEMPSSVYAGVQGEQGSVDPKK